MVEIETDSIQTPTVMQSESLKLTKNSRGYTWEIRILSLDIKRLEQINEEMKIRFGSISDDVEK